MSAKPPISPSQIESHLNTLWDKLKGTNQMRASLFNLIIVAQKDEREKYFKLIAQKVIEKFPSRILFVTIDPHQDALNAFVSLMTASEGGSSFACDLIEIEVGGSFIERIPFLILPHILPDLPIYLLRGDDPCAEMPVALQLESFAKRIIFDSEATDDLPKFAQTILKHRQELDADIADLNWGRIEDWRALLAATFHTPERLAMLQSAEALHIHYNCIASPFYCHTKIQAIYLSAWLATQFGWHFESMSQKEGITLLTFKEILIHLHPSTVSDIPAGRLISFTVQTSKEESLSLSRNPTCPNYISIELTTPQSCAIPTNYLLDKEVSGLSLVREICHKGTSQHFTAVLRFVAALNSKEIT